MNEEIRLDSDMTEYVPDNLLFDFISNGLPNIEVIKMKLPVDVDENGTEMYVAESALVGKESDGDTAIANSCLEYLSQQINKTGHKKLGIYKLIRNSHVGIAKSPSITLRYSFPQPMEISKVEDVYVPRFTKEQNPFQYNQRDKTLKGKV